jgi:hypothetical protein
MEQEQKENVLVQEIGMMQSLCCTRLSSISVLYYFGKQKSSKMTFAYVV